VRRGEKVTVAVPVHTYGKHDADGILEHVHNTVEVEVETTNIPSELKLNIEGLKAGESKSAADVELPAGAKLVSDPKMTVVHLGEKSTHTEEAAAPAADAAAPAAAEAPQA
jgi:large subunit ribosomal protein L25